MPISSLLVRTVGDRTETVRGALDAIEGVSVTDAVGDQLVVILESRDMEGETALARRVEAEPGVVSATLVYHNFEDVEDPSCPSENPSLEV